MSQPLYFPAVILVKVLIAASFKSSSHQSEQERESRKCLSRYALVLVIFVCSLSHWALYRIPLVEIFGILNRGDKLWLFIVWLLDTPCSRIGKDSRVWFFFLIWEYYILLPQSPLSKKWEISGTLASYPSKRGWWLLFLERNCSRARFLLILTCPRGLKFAVPRMLPRIASYWWIPWPESGGHITGVSSSYLLGWGL